MIITGMAHFESVCKKKLVNWYNKNDDIYHTQQRIDLSNVFIVWSCKTLQNYKCLASTTVPATITMFYVSYYTTYCNALNMWIKSVTKPGDLDQIQWGAKVPEEFQSEVLKDYMKTIASGGIA